MALDNMGRVFLTNDPDTSVFADHMDIHHYYFADRRSFALAVLILFTFASTFTIALRIYTRTRLIKAFGPDDWVMVVAQLGFFHYLGFQFAEIVFGTGLHRSKLTIDNAERGLKYWYLCALSYSLTTVFVKVAIGLFLLRFTTNRIQTGMIWAINISCVVVGLGYFIFLSLTCYPFAFYWDLDPNATGYCFTPKVWLDVGYAMAACNVVADSVFAIIPMVIVWNTTMKRKTKVGVCILLGMGSVAVVGTIVRTVYGHTFSQYKNEFLFETCLIAILSTVELGLGITAANIATLRPLFREVRQWTKSTRGSSRLATQTMPNSANIRWVTAFNVDGGTEDRGLVGYCETVSPNESHKTMKSIVTGRESMSEMPDLVFAGADVVEKGGYELEELDFGERGLR
ncbi:hypothetical protein CAC42_3707 [Sphaceloma murrayae]|uniref:Rhodopsin domain-containing protein n=1 Tax=Sphaceloma murrayae TaxID=2082308 RepID=A0A2K1QHL4_9PEZI|nr:hypothetical protein CAC42_3707 [Sphaceloma murrayae]